MLRYLILAIALLIFVSAAFAVIVTVVVFVAMMCAVAVPAYLVGRHWLGTRRQPAQAQTPIDRLQTMYVEGKIDLFEFERRVAHILTVER